MNSNIYLPKTLRFGADISESIAELCQELGVSKPLIVTDSFIVQCGYLDKITAPMSAANILFKVFADCVPDPTTDSVNQGVAYWHSGDFDCLIALGGGSVLDSAKAISVLAKHGGEIKDYKAPAAVPRSYPVIAIPTTAGTGSEATRVMVVTDTSSGEKMMCLGLGLMPEAALVDYKLTLTMPYRLTADTGLDTLCHALEAYVSKKANPFTDPIALSCLNAVASNLETACNEPENIKAREAMMMAATQGGIAFSNSSVTLIHGMSRPIGGAFHVPHGMSNAMLLPVVTEFSMPGAKQRYAQAATAMGWADGSDTTSKALSNLLDGLYRLCSELSVPTLEAFGIKQSIYFAQLETMAQQALSSGSPNNNPVVPSKAEIIKIYQKIWA